MSATNQSKKLKLSSDLENKSFVGQMATTVTRLLPNTITRWFSSPSNAIGSTQMTESTDSSTEDESTDVASQPPVKLMRYNLSGPSSIYSTPKTRSISTNTEPINVSDHVGNRGVDSLDTNTASKTSDETSVIHNKPETSYNLQDSLSNSQPSSRKRKSLDVKATLSHLGDSIEKRYENKPFIRTGLAASSPFYRGNTKYGGSNNLYVNKPNIIFKKSTHINNSLNDVDATMSNSSKRIMDLLDNFSSPTIEARRIPQMSTSALNNTEQSFNNTVTCKRNLSFQKNELHVPSVASVLKLKERSRLMNTTRVARQIIASQSSSSDMYQAGLLKSTDDKFTSKIRSRVTKVHQNSIDLEPPSTPVHLPTAVLQIDKDNLPKFSFGISVPDHSSSRPEPVDCIPKPNVNTVSSKEPEVDSTNTHLNKNENFTHDLVDSNSFKFSSPVRICIESVNASTSSQKFAFGIPERNVENKKSNQESRIKPLSTSVIWPSKTQLVEKVDKDTKEKQQCTECKIELKNEQSDKCTDCDQVKHFESLPASVTASKWKCGDCWVDNDEDKENCVCCGSKKQSKAKPTNVLSGNKDNFKHKTNDSINSKQTIKSNNITPTTNTETMVNSSLRNIVEQQSSKWECPNCMVRNENNKSKCVCCETEKPGTVKVMKTTSFNFGIVPNVSFKFGIDPKQNIAKKGDTDLGDSKTSTNKPENKQTEANNEFVFDSKLENKEVESQSENGQQSVPLKQGSISKTAFSFGIPKESSVNSLASTSSTSKQSFNMPKQLDTAPKIKQDDNTNLTPEPTKPISGMKAPDTNISLPISSSSALPELNKVITVTQPSNNSTTADNVIPQNKFCFSSSSLTSSANLFNTPKPSTSTETVTATISSNQITSNAQSTPSISFFSNTNNNSSPQPILFKKNETETSTTLSLFSKLESTKTTTVAQAPTSNAPVFSFGSNTSQNAQQTAEKSKFSFAFGANKSDAPMIFKGQSSFGGNSTINKFSISNTGTLGSNSMSNAKNNNTLNNPMGNNHILGSNIIGNTGMGSNVLGSSTIGNNSLGNSNMVSALVNNSTSNNVMGNNALSNNGLSNSNGLSAGNTLGGLSRNNGVDSLSNNIGASNPLMPGASMSPVGGSIFNSVPKKDIWSVSNTAGSNIFVSNAATNSNSFNANNTSSPTFVNPTLHPPQATQSASPVPNIFGNSSNNQTLFANAVQNPPSQPSVFGTVPPAAPQMGMFRPPAFGSPNTTFDNVSMNPTQTPAFNFRGSNNQPTFGFSQQPQMQQQSGVYNFGSPAGTNTPQVQFNMGSYCPAPVVARKIRKVIRRTTAR